MLTLDLKSATANFFDSELVLKHVEAGQRKSLSKIGAFVRRRARSSLRRRKKVAAAGSPPSVHSDDPFRSLKNILFAYDAESQSVVVGAIAFQSNSAAAVQESGGTTTIVQKRKNGRVRKVQIKIKRHAFMAPALEAEQAATPEMFRNLF